MDVSNLQIIIGADTSQFDAAMRQIATQMSALSKSINDLDKDIKKISGSFSKWKEIKDILDIFGDIKDIIDIAKDIKKAWGLVRVVFAGVGKSAEVMEAETEGGVAGVETMATAAEESSGIFGVLGGALEEVGEAILALSPEIDVVIIIVGLLIAAVIALIDNWDKFKQFISDMWDKVKKAFSDACNAIGNFFISLWDKVKDATLRAGLFVQGIWTPIKKFFIDTWKEIKEVGVGIWDAIKKAIESVAGFIEKIFAKIKSVINWVKDKVSGLWSDAGTSSNAPDDGVDKENSFIPVTYSSKDSNTTDNTQETIGNNQTGYYGNTQSVPESKYKNAHTPEPIEATPFAATSIPTISGESTVLGGIMPIPQIDKKTRSIQKFNYELGEMGLKAKEAMTPMQALGQIGTTAIEGLTDAFAGLLTGAKNPFKAFAKMMGDSIKKLGQHYAALGAPFLLGGVLSGDAAAIKKGLGYEALGIGLEAAGVEFAKLASGGIVSGSTFANIGEYAGASHNPEVVAPLDKLRGMLGGGAAMPGKVQLYSRFDSLQATIDRGQRSKGFVNGF